MVLKIKTVLWKIFLSCFFFKGNDHIMKPFNNSLLYSLSLGVYLVDKISLCVNFQGVHYSGDILCYYVRLLTCMCVYSRLLCLICASVWLVSWMTSNFHSSANLEVSYMFRKFPTSLWLLVDVRTYLRYLYTCWVQPYLYGSN